MNPSRKQIKITADLVARALHNADELNQPYIFVIQGIDTIFSNVNPLHARAILFDASDLQVKVAEQTIESRADKLTAIPGTDNGTDLLE